ncbi:MAG: phosphate ABC transporter permease PstA [Alphaproteobacteria bacterium]|nr:phosphate ABC transporter permease PstA [Alphaproteobacteria bacterium]
MAGAPARLRRQGVDISARGEPFLWGLGGALAFGVVMILGFLFIVFWNGATTFWPGPIDLVTLTAGERIAGEPTRSEDYRPTTSQLAELDDATRARIAARDGFATRTLYRVGNFDIYGEDFRWVSDFQVSRREQPADLALVERLEWGVFIGQIKAVTVDDKAVETATFATAHKVARQRWLRIADIERDEIGAVNHRMEQGRLEVRRAELDHGKSSPAYARIAAEVAKREQSLGIDYAKLSAEAQRLRAEAARTRLTLAEIGGKEKTIPLSAVVRLYPANALGPMDKLGVYLSRWWEFLSDEPREANTEGGVWPAIFGTFAMTLLMVIVVAPFGVITALYLREYARQGRLVTIVRISVNNLAGVPSIVYGAFGLGFFAYILGGSIDQFFYPERLPSPTFGTGGLLWSSLTLALLTVPVVIVATEEALAAVPRSMREGSLACGASKWQTILNIVLPRAMPGIMTGLILAMARGAGEVAPLMLVGVVKLAPELPIDGIFPYVHLERSFMHLGFHIYDVGFQSRNSEAGKPMVFVTTMLLIALIATMNASAIVIRNRLKRKFVGSQF